MKDIAYSSIHLPLHERFGEIDAEGYGLTIRHNMARNFAALGIEGAVLDGGPVRPRGQPRPDQVFARLSTHDLADPGWLEHCVRF